jgi:hypothetical protein
LLRWDAATRRARRERAGVDNRQAREKPKCEPVLVTVLAQSLLSPTRIPAHVGGNGDRFGADLAGEPDGLCYRVATANDEITSAVDERGAEVGQAVVEKSVAVG